MKFKQVYELPLFFFKKLLKVFHSWGIWDDDNKMYLIIRCNLSFEIEILKETTPYVHKVANGSLLLLKALV